MVMVKKLVKMGKYHTLSSRLCTPLLVSFLLPSLLFFLPPTVPSFLSPFLPLLPSSCPSSLLLFIGIY